MAEITCNLIPSAGGGYNELLTKKGFLDMALIVTGLPLPRLL